MSIKKTARLGPGLMAVACLMASIVCQAETANLDQEVTFSIPPQSLESALLRFSQQANLQLLTSSDEIPNTSFAGITGRLAIRTALEALLQGTGLTYSVVRDGTVAIGARAVDKTAAAEMGQMRLAQLDQPSPSEGQGRGEDKKSSSQEEDAQNSKGIPEVLVTGRKVQSLNADIERTRDDVRPYVVFDRDTIQRSGATDITDFLRNRLTMNYVRAPNNSVAGTGLNGNASQIALRGLSAAETLILVDGRRITGMKTGLAEIQGDINTIPLSLIERIEILPATASGIYGGGATGGVVNIILRRDYTGLEPAVAYENSFEGGRGKRSASVVGGMELEDGKTSVLFNVNYANNNPLLVGDRDFFEQRREQAQNRWITEFPAYYYNQGVPILGATTNISSVSTIVPAETLGADCSGGICRLAPVLVLKSNNQSLGSSITSVPVGYTGSSSDNGAGLVTNAGRYNVDPAPSSQLGGAYSSFIGHTKVGSGGITVRRTFSSRIDAFLEASVSRNEQLFSRTPATGSFTISSTASTNPFRQPIVVVAPMVSADERVLTRIDGGHALGGLKLDLGHGWSSGLDYTFSVSKAEQQMASVQRTTGVTGATAAVQGGTINLLQDPSRYADEFANFIQAPNTIDPLRSTLHDVTLRFAGPAFSTWAGDSILSVLVEGKGQHYSPYTARTLSAAGAINTLRIGSGNSVAESLYSELRLPLASQNRSVFGIREAELQLSSRYDRYRQKASFNLDSSPAGTQALEGKFDSIDPSIGLRFRPLRDLVVRGSFGTGFLPPALNRLQENLPALAPAGTFTHTDSKRAGESLVTRAVDIYSGGNPQLKPEQSTSWSGGVIVEPRLISGLRASFDWTRTKKKDNITSYLASQDTINNEDKLPGFIIRGPDVPGDVFDVGPIIAFDQRARNANKALYESYDVSADYTISMNHFGDITFSATATKMIHSWTQASPVAVPVENVGSLNAPTWNGTASAVWRWGGLTMVGTARYFDRSWILTDHSFNLNLLGDKVPSETYFDLVSEYDFGSRSGRSSVFSDLVIQVGLKNIFNTPPRLIVGGVYYESSTDPTMASYFLSLRKSLRR